MKKTLILSIIALCACTAAFAGNVSPDKARTVASNMLGPATKGSSLMLVRTGGPEYSVPLRSCPSYYVFSRTGGGFVIVSGEDCTRPVLAYSLESTFPAGVLPPNLESWLDSWSRHILGSRKAGAKAPAAVSESWEQLSAPETKSTFRSPAANGAYLDLGTAEWGQGYPFNYFCPIVENATEKSVTGCVATAAAEIMKYYAYPDAGSGSLPSYEYTLNGTSINHTEPGHALGTVYNWSAMGMTTASILAGAASDSTALKNIAQLIYDLGVMVQMQYNENGSGSITDYLPVYMGMYMGYAKSAAFEYKNNYSDAEWKRKLKVLLKAGHPLIYSGTSAYEGGHAFILEGYDEADYFLCNWGWNGNGNGFYALDDLNPIIEDPSGFLTNQGAIFGMVPDPGSVTRDPSVYIDKNGDNLGIALGSGTINDSGTAFYMNTGMLYNMTLTAYNGNVRFALVNAAGAFKEFISAVLPLNLAARNGAGYSNVACSISSSTLALGDKITIYYEAAPDSYVPAQFNEENGTVGEYPVFDMPRIALSGSYTAGDVISLKLDNTIVPYTSAAWTFDGAPAMASEYIVLTAGSHTVKVVLTYSDGSTETVVQEINVS